MIVGGKEFSVSKINRKNDSVNKNVAAKAVKVKKNNVIVNKNNVIVKKLTKSDLKKIKKLNKKGYKVKVPAKMPKAEFKKLVKELKKAGINPKNIERFNPGDINNNNNNEIVSKVSVTKGNVVLTSRLTLQTHNIPAGMSVIVDSKGNVTEQQISDDVKSELQDSLNKMNEKQSTKQIIDKLNGQTGQINDAKKALDNALDSIKKITNSNTSSDMIKQAADAFKKALEEGKRFVSIYVEVNSCINVLSQRIADKSELLEDKEAAAEAIKNANTAMNNFSQSLDALSGYADIIEEKLGINVKDSLSLMAEKAKEIKDALEDANRELEDIVKEITDESSYNDFKDAVSRCEALLQEIQKYRSIIKADEVGILLADALNKQYDSVSLKIEKTIRDYSSVPEIKTDTLKQMNDFENNVPDFASNIRKYLREYKAIEGASTDTQKRYVESVTRTLASYDRMRRVYTKANRMYTQMEREFAQSKFKTSEYNEVKESWEKIEQAMTEIDSEASELSSCVEDLKNQLEGLLGQ